MSRVLPGVLLTVGLIAAAGGVRAQSAEEGAKLPAVPVPDRAPSASVPDPENAAVRPLGAAPDSTATAEREGGRFIFEVHLKTPSAGDRVCSYDRATGSHRMQRYCRSRQAAAEERKAAREFLLTAMRNAP